MNKLFMDCMFKEVGEKMTFSAYGNVKNVIDHVRDVAVDGCYEESIKRMVEKGMFAKLLWGHDSWNPPVGKITHMEEDSKGLLFEGKLSKTERGKELHVLAMDKALDSFSIGYTVQDEDYDRDLNINYLKEIDIKEISFVNFACNEESRLVDIKSQIIKGDMPTKREMEMLFRSKGFSRSEATKIASCYDPGKKALDISAIKEHPFFR